MKKIILSALIMPCVFAKVPDNGFYADLGLGASMLNYYGAGTSGMLRIDGGYNLNPNLGVQAGFNSFFGASVTNNKLGTTNVSGNGIDFSVIPNIPFGKNNAYNLFFRAGLGYDFMNSSITNQNSLVDVLGVGFRYDISAHLTTSIQWLGRGLIVNPGNASYSANTIFAAIGLNF